MKVFFPDVHGFCFGVQRAMNEAIKIQQAKKKKIYILGELIHNKDAINYLKSNQIITTSTCKNLKNQTILIRAHGEAKNIIDSLSQNEVIDLTCPFVKKIHHLVHKYYQLGYQIIIIGQENHPEVIGINGWCDNKAIVISEDSDKKPIHNACIVVQTTFIKEKFDAITAKIVGDNCVIFNTICSHTKKAQESVIALARKMDSMIIVGGKHSSNSKKLFQLASKICPHSFFIENENELDLTVLHGEKIGIAAGASTPSFIIEKIQKKIEEFT